jgi:UPF0271 protein
MATPIERTVDLATELGESFALPPGGIALADLKDLDFKGRRLHPRHLMARDDGALLDIISTGYVACGAHAGDAIVMGRTIRMLVEKGIAIGAHPSYPDVFGFGQEPVDVDDMALHDIVLTQVATIAALAESAGTRLATVKCHGALSFDVSYDERTAQVFARTLYKFDPTISLVCMAGSPGVRIARDCGIPVVQEAYIDRAYDCTGRIVSRSLPGALITEPSAAAAQLLSVVREGRVRAVDGTDVRMHADSFCLHSDTPNAAAISRAVVAALRDHGIHVRVPAGTSA